MKKTRYYIGCMVSVVFMVSMVSMVFSSCSNISDDERLTTIYIEPQPGQRIVLIEDFTGQACVNCPNATDAIHEIQKVFSDSVVAVAIHSGPMGVEKDGKYKGVAYEGLMNTFGKEYWNKWFDSTTGQPVVMMNRSLSTVTVSSLMGYAVEQLQRPTDVELTTFVSYDEATREVTVSSSTLAPAGTKAKYQIWVTEDSIQALQKMPDGSYNSAYVHNHVLRDAPNGAWGEEITYGEQALALSNKFTLKECTEGKTDYKWKEDNINIITFVYDDEEGILQATSTKLKK